MDLGNATSPESYSLVTRMMPAQMGGQAADASAYGKPCPADQLKVFADYSRSFLQAAMEANIEGANRLFTHEFGVTDPFDDKHIVPVNKWQRPPQGPARYQALATEWDINDCNDGEDFELHWHSIVSALRSLCVGDPGADFSQQKWMLPRHIDGGLLHPPPTTLQNTGYNIALEAEEAGSEAKFTTVYNVLDGVIVVQSATSPYHNMKGRAQSQHWQQDLPKIPHHSDMLWAMWERLHSTGRIRYGLSVHKGKGPQISEQNPYRDALQHITPIGGDYPEAPKNIFDLDIVQMKPFLNWYVVQAVEDEKMREVVASCLHSRGWGGYEKGWPRWHNQETFSVGHWCFYALLAQPINRSVAFLLIQHKSPVMLDRKMLKSVSIFYGEQVREDANDIYIAQRPSLAWEIVDVHQDVINLKTTFESRWVHMNSWEHFAETIPIAHPNPGSGLDLTDTGLTPGPGHTGLTPGPGDEGLTPRPYA
ncbi:hypothetical protein LTR86_010299 [Recurvomyces mirabilis]|nr:hypothetical protein LTR86_010299 [Recurvomyces mirabilis]